MIELDTAHAGGTVHLRHRGWFALAIVPWACIGTGLVKKDKQYQSY